MRKHLDDWARKRISAMLEMFPSVEQLLRIEAGLEMYSEPMSHGIAFDYEFYEHHVSEWIRQGPAVEVGLWLWRRRR